MQNHGFAQSLTQSIWQQKVDYTIQVELDDKLNTLQGQESIGYHNNSPDTLTEIYVHLWANAYLDNSTPFAEQQVRVGNTKFYYAPEKDRGGINANFSIDGKLLEPRFEKGNLEVAVLSLNAPLLPGDSLLLTSKFNVKVPKEFSRMGNGETWFGGKDYQITQWFPKVAMYDVNGWQAFNYLDMGEFYDNFGDYKVSITLPSHYIVGASGILLENEQEEAWMDELSKTIIKTV